MPGVVALAFRLPNNARVSRRFAAASPSEQIYAWLSQAHGLPMSRTQVSTSFPRKVRRAHGWPYVSSDVHLESDPLQDIVNSSEDTLLSLGLTQPQILSVSEIKT